MMRSLVSVAKPIIWVLAVVAALKAGGAGQVVGGQKVSELTFENFLESRKVTVPGRRIRAAAPEALPAATPDSVTGFSCPFGSSLQNSRVGRPLPEGEWQLRWSADVDPAFPPEYLVEAPDGILVESGKWRLLDRAGKELRQDRATSAPMIVDAAHNLFFDINTDAYLEARRLTTGEHEFRILPAYGDMYRRIHLARQGNRVVVAGVERELDPHREHPATHSLVEVIDLGDSPKADDMGFLANGSTLGTLLIPVPQLVAASSPDLIVAATHDWIYLINWDLQVQAGLEGSFDPQAISLDESGRIYLLAERTGVQSLLLLKSGGERLYSFDLPSTSARPSAPPIVGFDHTAYVLSGSRIYAVNTDGHQRWAKSAASIAGAVITADHHLIVTESSGVAAYNEAGDRKEVLRQAGLVTPPLLTREGELLVASKSVVYCYAVK